MNAPTAGKNLMYSLRGLLSSQAEESDAHAGGLSAWAPDSSENRPEQAAKDFIRQVAIIRHQRQNIRAQFKQLEILLKKAEPHLIELEAQLNQCALPLSTDNRETATTVDSLLRAFAQSYYELAETFGGKWFRVLHSRQSPLAALRAAQLIHRRALLAYRVYSNGSSQRWKQYQTLLAMNEEAKQDEASDNTANSAAESLSRIVVQSCLLALTDPSRLKEEDITRVRLYTERYAHLASLHRSLPKSVDDQTAGFFVLSDSSRGPQKLKPEHAEGNNCHFLDTRALVHKIEQQIQGLKDGQQPSHLGLPNTANEPSYLLLLMQCKDQWSLPRKRRHQRSGVRPRADLVSGFEAVYQFVAQKALTRRKSDEDHSSITQPTSEWSIVDQSEGGFGLRFIKGHAGSISIGEIVALCFKEHASLALCIVRRARSITGAEFDIGLELLAEKAFATSLPGNQGKQPPPPSKTIPAILLPRLANAYNVPAVLLPIDRPHDLELEISVRSNGNSVRLAATNSLENLASCELMEMKPVRN